jgi:hypothetical protein
MNSAQREAYFISIIRQLIFFSSSIKSKTCRVTAGLCDIVIDSIT